MRAFALSVTFSGFTILELSKAQVYDQYYNVMVPALGGAVTVGFTDTDR